MHRPIRLSLGAAACVFAFACSSDTQSPIAEAPTYAVSDGAHNGNPDFFFLPPLFKSPVNNPNYEPNAANLTLKPSVEICELGPAASDGSRECIAGPAVKVFPASAVIVADEAYQVDWKTDETILDVTKLYRIRVLVTTALLGFADVDPVSSGKDLKNVQTNEYIPLLDGRTLPIKFRIESGALCAVDGSPCASETVHLNDGGEIELFGAGEDFKFVIPTGTTATFNGQTVTDVTFNLEICDGIDVDLPLYGPCLRVTTYFNSTETGLGELEFSRKLRISLCVLNEQHPSAEGQERLITLHQQDGTLIRALPHITPDCEGTIGSTGWHWLRSLAARLLAPKPAFAASRSAVLHVGAGGETGGLGIKCTTTSSSPRQRLPGIMMTTVCPPSSPTASGPQRVTTATVTPAQTITDFQFALPAKMDYVDPDDAQRSAAPGTALPTAVKVTDWDGTAVQGATVRFIEPPFEGSGEGTVVGTAISNADGIAQILWTISEGPNHVVATGRGIAAQNNYPEAEVKPFMPDISLPTEEQEPVALGTGRIHFFATGGQADLVISRFVFAPAEPTTDDLIEFEIDVSNAGTVPVTIPFQVDISTALPGSPGPEVTSLGVLTEGNPSLEPGESITLFTRATRAAATYSPTATADPTGVIAESNEENNSATISYTVSPPLGSLEFLQQPTNTPSGLAITPALQIRVLDPAGNPVSEAVRVTVGNDPSNPEGCLVLQTSTLALEGVAILDNVRVNGLCTGARVAASAGSEYELAFSNAFDITAPPVDFSVTLTPGTNVPLEGSVPYIATVTNNGGSLAGVAVQAFIEQGATNRAAGGAQMHDCSETSGLGELPPGPCSINRVLVASNAAAGTGTLVAGPATARIQVQWAGTAIAVLTIPINIVIPPPIGAPVKR